MKYINFFSLLAVFYSLPLLLEATFQMEIQHPASLIAYQIKNALEHTDSKFMNALINGIEANDNKLKLTADERKAYVAATAMQRELQAQNNLIASEEWLKRKNNEEKVCVMIPNELFYQTIKKGTGKILTGSSVVKINHMIYKFNCFFPEITAFEKKCDTSQLIPGFAKGMISMQEGEIRKIFIHPNLAYGNSNTFEPNIALEATVELLSIIPDQCEAPTPKEVNSIDKPKVTQDEIDELLLKSYYAKGWKLWEHLKFGYPLFSKEQLIDCLKNDVVIALSDSELNTNLNTIHWQIYHQRIEDEHKEATHYLDLLFTQKDVKCAEPYFLYYKSQYDFIKKYNTKNFAKIKYTIKDKYGEILQGERVETIEMKSAIRGLKEAIPYLPPGEFASLFIHPKWGFPDSDGPLGDKLLVIDIVVEKSSS